jgi:glycosyltransferase involved in cell wall biosynthesis
LHVRNISSQPGIGKFWGLVNPGLWRLIREGDFDAVVVYGYAYSSSWIALAAAKASGVPVLIGTDVTGLRSGDAGWSWKRWVKKPALRLIYGRLYDLVLTPSTATRKFLSSIGVPEERMFLTHYVVDNDFFQKHVSEGDRQEIRRMWNIPSRAPVILYCGKLIERKRPADLLRSFANLRHRTNSQAPFLVFTGDGVLGDALRAEARALGVSEQVRFAGFVNQTNLPAMYAAGDVFVLPSAHEPWGLVVNEAMNCGLPTVVSDRVGAAGDLVLPGETGEVYPVGDTDALTNVLAQLLSDPCRRQRLADNARVRIQSWSCREHVENMAQAIATAARLKDER